MVQVRRELEAERQAKARAAAALRAAQAVADPEVAAAAAAGTVSGGAMMGHAATEPADGVAAEGAGTDDGVGAAAEDGCGSADQRSPTTHARHATWERERRDQTPLPPDPKSKRTTETS